jgi:K+-transporting ATPase ATPase C chain
MLRSLQKSIFLLFSTLIICCGIYPLALWVIGQTFFPFQANGSILLDANNKPVGSLLIAQAFTKDEYFQPRPSAANYRAEASASSSLAPSNYVLRNRVANSLGSIVKYQHTGKLVGHDIETWFQQDKFQGQAHIVSIWATQHPELAKAWLNENPAHATFAKNWAKSHTLSADNAISFFQSYSFALPGKFPQMVKANMQAVNTGTIIQALFFDMWRQDHPTIELEAVPADMVMTSASGLDPHISLQNAMYQLDRVAAKWAMVLKRDQKILQQEILQLLTAKASAPLAGLAGEKIINVLEVNLELQKRYGILPQVVAPAHANKRNL